MLNNFLSIRLYHSDTPSHMMEQRLAKRDHNHDHARAKSASCSKIEQIHYLPPPPWIQFRDWLASTYPLFLTRKQLQQLDQKCLQSKVVLQEQLQEQWFVQASLQNQRTMKWQKRLAQWSPLPYKYLPLPNRLLQIVSLYVPNELQWNHDYGLKGKEIPFKKSTCYKLGFEEEMPELEINEIIRLRRISEQKRKDNETMQHHQHVWNENAFSRMNTIRNLGILNKQLKLLRKQKRLQIFPHNLQKSQHRQKSRCDPSRQLLQQLLNQQKRLQNLKKDLWDEKLRIECQILLEHGNQRFIEWENTIVDVLVSICIDKCDLWDEEIAIHEQWRIQVLENQNLVSLKRM